MMNFVLTKRNSVLKTRNCVFKTRNCVSKMMNFAGGLTWVQLTTVEKPLWVGSGTGSRRYDIGLMHQGQIIVQGERAFHLYFTEFPLNTTWCETNGLQTHSEMDTFGVMQSGCERSVLQLAEVHFDPGVSGGVLRVDRNQSFSFSMLPPPDRTKQTQARPTVWHVSKEDAMVLRIST